MAATHEQLSPISELKEADPKKIVYASVENFEGLEDALSLLSSAGYYIAASPKTTEQLTNKDIVACTRVAPFMGFSIKESGSGRAINTVPSLLICNIVPKPQDQNPETRHKIDLIHEGILHNAVILSDPTEYQKEIDLLLNGGMNEAEKLYLFGKALDLESQVIRETAADYYSKSFHLRNPGWKRT